jgi:hypothetical protein
MTIDKCLKKDQEKQDGAYEIFDIAKIKCSFCTASTFKKNTLVCNFSNAVDINRQKFCEKAIEKLEKSLK